MVYHYIYLDDETKLHEKEVAFLCDKKNAHLFPSDEEEDLSEPKKKRKLTVSSEYLTLRAKALVTTSKGHSSYARAYLMES